MTFREKLAQEHPEKCRSSYSGGCYGCPCDYGYEEKSPCQWGNVSEDTCKACWNREMPMTPEEREKAGRRQQTEHGGAGGIVRGGPIIFQVGAYDEQNDTAGDTTQKDRREDNDAVNHPSHYTAGGIECIDAIAAALTCQKDPVEAWLTGQVLKYLWRWPLKNGVEDLRKARWYLDRLINTEEEKS